MINNYGKTDEDVRVQDVIDGMKAFAKEHLYDCQDLNTNASGIEDYALDLQEAWDATKAHPEEWCNCDKCVSNNDCDNATLKAALLRIVNYVNQNEKLTDGERLFTVEKIARCALERYRMHSSSNNPMTCKVIEEACRMAQNSVIKERGVK